MKTMKSKMIEKQENNIEDIKMKESKQGTKLFHLRNKNETYFKERSKQGRKIGRKERKKE